MTRQDTEPALLKEDAKAWTEQVLHRKYRPHIDGMRCLAVLPVVFYHLAGGLCPGGFMGVDIFFVISGYLIFGGILTDLRKGTFSMATFYQRRIRRIFPAYMVVVFSTLLAGLFLYHWARLVPLSQTALFSAFFSTNLYFWLTMGYFQPHANGNALLHLWSLGVEEQFYIVIPLLTLALWKLLRTGLRATLFFLCMASLALCIVLGQRGDSTTAFYVLPTRAWELLAGALLADLPPRRNSLSVMYLSLLGLVFILLSFWCFNTEHTLSSGGTTIELVVPFFGSLGIYPFPGVTVLPVIVGSLLLLRFGDEGPVSRVLCSSPFTAIGKISYSLYLWHWPILVFARYLNYERVSPWGLVVVFLMSFLAAYLSWRWVEMPVRVGNWFSPRVAFASLGIGCGLLVAICAVLIATDGLRTIIHVKANRYVTLHKPFTIEKQKFFPRPPFRPPPYPQVDANYVDRIGLPGGKPSFCLVGDSHARALDSGLDRVAAEHHQSGFYISSMISPQVDETAPDIRFQIFAWIAANPDIHDVYIVGRWPQEYRILDGLAQLGDSGKIKPVVLDEKTQEKIESEFRHTAQWLVQHGKRVFIFEDVPDYYYFPCDIMARSQWVPLSCPIELTREDYLNRQKPFIEIFTKLEKEGLVTVIPLQTGLISGDRTVFMAPDGSPYYRDADHLTPLGSYHAAQVIAPLLWPQGAQ